MNKFDFNKTADKYDDFYSSEFGIKIDQIEKECMSSFIDEIPRGNTLEVGCGTGHWTSFFINNGFSIVGIDIANEMLKVAQKKNLKNAVFKYLDILNSGFDDEVFDNVFAVTSLEFVENQTKAFSEINRILKKNGYFVLAGFLKNSEFEKQKKNSTTFNNATFFSKESLFVFLSNFGQPIIKTCLKIDKGEVIDKQLLTGVSDYHLDTFVVGIVKKTLNFKS